MLVNQKSKQHKKIHPTRIYMEKCSKYNQIKIMNYSQIWGKVIAVCLETAIQGSCQLTIRSGSDPLNVGSTSKGLLTSSSSQILKRWSSTSPTTASMGNKLSKPRVWGYNSTSIRWFYHKLMPTNHRTYNLYKLFSKNFKGLPRKRSLQPNMLKKHREWLSVYLRET